MSVWSISDLYNHRGPHFEVPNALFYAVLSILKFIIIHELETSHFYFLLDPTNYLASVAGDTQWPWGEGLPGHTRGQIDTTAKVVLKR